MMALKLKTWRTIGATAAVGLAAACGGETGASGEGGESGGEAGEAAVSAPVEPAAAAAGGEGGEAGEAGAATAYEGLSGDQRTALRLQHLKGFVMAAERVASENQPDEAAILIQQGVLEVYDGAPSEFGGLNVELVRAAGDMSAQLNRAQRVARIEAAEAEIDRAAGGLDVDYAGLAARMVDIATGLYQHVIQADFVDAIEYQHSMGAAFAARDALARGENALKGENRAAYSAAQTELTRFAGLWSTVAAPEQPATYPQVLAQGSRVRLALSPYL